LFQKLIILGLIAILWNIGGVFTAWPLTVQAAQSTGDSLVVPSPTVTATTTPIPTKKPWPTFTASAPTAPTKLVWVGRLVNNRLYATKGNGSIFRVKVEGMVGTALELQNGDMLLKGISGSKPEYGLYTAEFAPLSEGLWTISVPALGVSFKAWADTYNLVEIEFWQVPSSEATPMVDGTATATPLGGRDWAGQVLRETWGIGANFSRLLVQVVGHNGQPVRISTLTQAINTANTGQKLELGTDIVEFAGLTPGNYIIEPVGLNSFFEVQLKANTETLVQFQQRAAVPINTPTVQSTATRLPWPTWTPRPTSTPTITPSPTTTPSPTNTLTPLPSPTPVTRWLGAVESRQARPDAPSRITVRVFGITGLPIRLPIKINHSFSNEQRCITGQAQTGTVLKTAPVSDSCTFENLAAGEYLVIPEGLSINLPIMLTEHQEVVVIFDLEVLPSGVTTWQAQIRQNNNGALATLKADSAIRVRVAGRVGQVVTLRYGRGSERFCETAPNSVCQFDRLAAGVYWVEALNTGAHIRLFIDGTGQAEIEFAPNTLAVATPIPAVVGYGARAHNPTATATPMVMRINPTATPYFSFTPTPTATITPTLTPTPAFAWQGRIIKITDKVVGTIGVRAAGLKDHPVILRSGGWQSGTQLTGTKPELGEYATEFGGIAQGDYFVQLVGLAELKVHVGADQYILVEFRYDFVKK